MLRRWGQTALIRRRKTWISCWNVTDQLRERDLGNAVLVVEAPARPLGSTTSQQPGVAQLLGGMQFSATAREGHGGMKWHAPLMRSLHGSAVQERARAAALGVVDKLHETTAIVMPATGRKNFWEVLEFKPDATVLETWKTPEVLQLHPRDVYVFASDASIMAQRAVIAARPSAILLKTEVCKAIIYFDKAILFPSRRLQDTVRIAQNLKSAICQKSTLPFEFKVLESLMAETVRSFETKSKRLGIVAESVLSEINSNFHSSAGELQRLLPIQRKLNELQNDVKDVLDAIADIVNYDDSVKALCLTENQRRQQQVVTQQQQQRQAVQQHQPDQPAAWPPQPAPNSKLGVNGFGDGSPAADAAATAAAVAAATASAVVPSCPAPVAPNPPKKRTSHMRMVTAVLESYENKLLGINQSLREQLEGMEQTRTVWHMQLDHQRNRVLRVNLLISIMSFGVVLCTMPAAFLGMNVSSGLEDVPGIFWPIVQASLLGGTLCGSLVYVYYKFGPKRRYKARLRDMRALRDMVMFHMDDIDDIITEVKARGRVSRAEFTNLVREAVKGRPMSQDEIDLVYRVFDTNHDGFLEMTELLRVEEQIDSFSRTHLS